MLYIVLYCIVYKQCYRKVISSRFPIGVPTRYKPGFKGPWKIKHATTQLLIQQPELKKNSTREGSKLSFSFINKETGLRIRVCNNINKIYNRIIICTCFEGRKSSVEV